MQLNKKTHSLAICSPHALMAGGVAGVLAAAGFDIRGRHESLEGLRSGLEKEHVTGIILDACVVEDDVNPIRELSLNGYRIILVADEERSGHMLRDAMLAGASGMLSDHESTDIFVKTVELVMAGSWVASGDLAPRMVEVAVRKEAPTERIAVTERTLALLVAQGATNREIAEVLTISEHTAKSQVAHLLDKLGLENRQQLAVWVVQQGLYEAPAEPV